MSTPSQLAHTPAPPYFAVIFTSQRSSGDHGYDVVAARMVELGSRYPGFLGLESARAADGFGITVSYWRDEASIIAWKRDAEHERAQRGGRELWYEKFHVRVAKVERAYGGEAPST